MLEEDFKLVRKAMHITPDLREGISALDRIKKKLEKSQNTGGVKVNEAPDNTHGRNSFL